MVAQLHERLPRRARLSSFPMAAGHRTGGPFGHGEVPQGLRRAARTFSPIVAVHNEGSLTKATILPAAGGVRPHPNRARV
jgi:hypothetical protein